MSQVSRVKTFPAPIPRQDLGKSVAVSSTPASQQRMRNSTTRRAGGAIFRRGVVLAAILVSCVDAHAERLPIKTYCY